MTLEPSQQSSQNNEWTMDFARSDRLTDLDLHIDSTDRGYFLVGFFFWRGGVVGFFVGKK